MNLSAQIRAVWSSTHFDLPELTEFARPKAVEEALDRLQELNANGPSERAFGWESLPNVRLWEKQRCA